MSDEIKEKYWGLLAGYLVEMVKDCAIRASEDLNVPEEDQEDFVKLCARIQCTFELDG